MRKAPALALLLMLAGCAGAPRDDDYSRRPPPTSPSDLVSAEMAFNRLAQEKGQWTAFRETAAQDAVMFVPEMVEAQSWLKGRANPAQSVRWQAYNVFMSCDGTLGATTGAAQWPDGKQGYFISVWRRSDKARGTADILKQWSWVADAGGPLATPLTAPESIETRIASCKGAPVSPDWPVPSTTHYRTGISTDRSLEWYASLDESGQQRMFVNIWDGENMISVIESKKVQE